MLIGERPSSKYFLVQIHVAYSRKNDLASVPEVELSRSTVSPFYR